MVPVFKLLKTVLQVFQIQTPVLLCADLGKIHISLSPRENIAVVLKRSHKYDRTVGILSNRLHQMAGR